MPEIKTEKLNPKSGQIEDESLNATNFREFAKKMIAKYEQKNMVIDAMLWSAIVGHYNRALDEKSK